MNCVERVVKALNHEEADRAPNYLPDADFKRAHLMQELAKTYGSYEK